MKLPEPITMLESVEQIKHLWWCIVHELTGWRRAEYMVTLSHTKAFTERKYIVGRQQAEKDYYE